MSKIGAFFNNTVEKFFPRTTPEKEVDSKIIREVYDIAPPTNFINLFSMYKTNSWIFAAVNAIVHSCTAVPLRIRSRQDKAIVSPSELIPIGSVLKYPNPNMTRLELLERLFLHLEICGNAFWELVVDQNSNRLIAIFPLDPSNITIVPDARRFIRKYTYYVNGSNIDFAPEEIVHFKYEDPQNEYWGFSPSLVMHPQARLEGKMKTYLEKYFDNDATPGIILKTDKILSDTTYERLRKRWISRHGGVNNKFSVGILEDGMTLDKIGAPLTEIDTTAIKNNVRDEIMVSSGVPPTLLGVPGVANYASARVAQSMFFDSHIAPRLAKVALTVDKEIMSRFAPDHESIFDTSVSPVNVVKLSANSRVVSRLYTLDLLTRNESRALLGMVPDPNGDYYYSDYKSGRAPSTDEGSADTGEAVDAGEAGSDS